MSLNITIYDQAALRNGAMPIAVGAKVAANPGSPQPQVVALGAQSAAITGPATLMLTADEDQRISFQQVSGYTAPAASGEKLVAGKPYRYDLGTGIWYVNVVASATSVTPRISIAAVAGTDRSATATATSATLMAANPGRNGYFIKNDAAVDVWVNFGAAASAAPGGGNLRIAANGGYLENPAGAIPSTAINIVTGSGTAAITAREL